MWQVLLTIGGVIGVPLCLVGGCGAIMEGQFGIEDLGTSGESLALLTCLEFATFGGVFVQHA